MGEADLRAAVEAWIADDPDPGDRAELQALLERAFPAGGARADAGAGVAGAVVPESVVPPGGPLRAVHFRSGALRRTIGLASRKDRPLSPAAEAFVAALDQHVADLKPEA